MTDRWVRFNSSFDARKDRYVMEATPLYLDEDSSEDDIERCVERGRMEYWLAWISYVGEDTIFDMLY